MTQIRRYNAQEPFTPYPVSAVNDRFGLMTNSTTFRSTFPDSPIRRPVTPDNVDEIRLMDKVNNIDKATNTTATANKSSSLKMTIRLPDITTALVGVVYNLVLGLMAAAHGIFMQWGILYIVGNLILIDFNDLLREDLEKIIGGEFPDIDSPGLIVLVIWFLEAVVGVTLALTVQDDEEEETSVVEWAWKVGRYATLPFFIVDAVAIVLAIMYFTGDVGMQVTLWAAGTRVGTCLMVLMEVGIFAKTCGPTIVQGAKRAYNRVKRSAEHIRENAYKLDNGSNGEKKALLPMVGSTFSAQVEQKASNTPDIQAGENEQVPLGDWARDLSSDNYWNTRC